MFRSLPRMRTMLGMGPAGRARNVLVNVPTPLKIQKKHSHDDGPPQPFDNMPFNVTNRFLCTVFFAVFFGSGLWAPYVIVWYSMAKRAL